MVKPATKLPTGAGEAIATAIRAGGGLFIRYKQERALKDTLAEANPLIQDLMKQIQGIADRRAADFEKSEKDLKTYFKVDARASGMLSFATFREVFGDLSLARHGQELAKKIGDEAKAYAAAHQALFDKTREKMDLRELLEEVQTFCSIVEGTPLAPKSPDKPQ